MKVKVLMVCLGNICRSPLAEGILKSKVDPKEIFVDSAGTAGYHVGKPPDARSIEVAKEFSLDISRQRCRQFTPEDFNEFDIIYVMDRNNLADVAGQANSERDLEKLRLLLASNEEVPDPYYGGPEGFRHIYKLIDKACTRIASELK